MGDDVRAGGVSPAGAPADPAGPPRGLRGLPRRDLVTLVLAWCALVPDLVLGFASVGDSVFGLVFGGFVFVTVNALLLGGTAAVAQSLLGPRSAVRWLRGTVPRRYHVVVLTWFVCVVTAPLVSGFEGLYLGKGFTGWRTMGPGMEPIVAVDPAVTDTLNAISLLARLIGPVLLLVMRALDVRGSRRRGAAGPSDAVGAPAARGGGHPTSSGVPWPVPSLLDTALLVVVWCAPPAALAIKMTHVGWGIFVILFASPFLLPAAVHGLWVFTAVLGGRSRVRAKLGTVPAVYRLCAAGWSVAVLLPGLAFVEFGGECLDDDCGWEPASALESLLDRPVAIEVAATLVVVGLLVAAVLQATVDAFRRADAPRPSRNALREERERAPEGAPSQVPDAPRQVWLPGPPSWTPTASPEPPPAPPPPPASSSGGGAT